jgi:hypothetical protein
MNMLRLGIIVADELESHLKIAKNIAKFANAEICKLTCNSDVIVAMDSSSPYLPPLALGKLRGSYYSSLHTRCSLNKPYALNSRRCW